MVFFPCCTSDDNDVLITDADASGNRALDRLPAPAEFEAGKARLSAMLIVGHTTPTTAKVWARVPEAGPWTVVLRAGRPVALGGGIDDKKESSTTCAQTHEFGKDQASTALTSTDRLLNHCFEFTALEPDTRYYYALVQGDCDASSQGIIPEGPRPFVLDLSQQQDPNDNEQCYFRTARTTGGVTFAAYSCHDPYSWAQGEAVEGAWPQLARLARSDVLDLTIGGGDQVYVDSNEIAMTDLWIYLRENRHHLKQKFVTDGNHIQEKELMAYLTQLIREYYLIYWNFPNLRAVHSRVPAYMMWDDHEIMDGWGSVDRQERIVKLKKKTQLREVQDDTLLERIVELTFQAASAVYNEYQHSHNPGRPYRPGTDDPRTFSWDFAWSRGECHFFALDMRGGHNCDAKSDRLLGKAQHDRLQQWLDGLQAAGAKSAFVVAPVPVVHWSTITEHAQLFIPSLKDDLMDGWGHATNHVERAKLLKVLFATSDRLKIPITIVSGDVHCASCYTLKDTKNYPSARIIQVTSSSISRKPCGSAATIAYAPNGRMQERLDDGRGKIVKTSIYQKQVFAKAGVNNFVVISAKGGSIDITFYWPAKDGKGTESAKVDLTK